MILCMFPTFAMQQFMFRLFKSIFEDRVAILAHEFSSTKRCSDQNLDRKSCFIATNNFCYTPISVFLNISGSFTITVQTHFFRKKSIYHSDLTNYEIHVIRVIFEVF